MALAIEISGHNFGENDAQMSQLDFHLLVEAIYEKINLLDKWSKSRDEDEDDDDEGDGDEGEVGGRDGLS